MLTLIIHGHFGFIRKYSASFGNIRLLSETFGCFRKHSVFSGNTRLLSETFGLVREHSASFGNIRVSVISIGVACKAVVYLPSLKRLQRSKICRERFKVFNSSLSLQTLSVEEKLSINYIKDNQQMSLLQYFFIVRHNPTCFGPLSDHHQGYP